MELLNGFKKAKILSKNCQYVLLDFEGFLCTDNKFLRFSVDDEYLDYLKDVFKNIIKCDKDAKIVACAYKDDLVDNEGNVFIYADSIWISTKKSKEYLIEIFNGATEGISPSDISTYSTINELIESEILYICNDGNIMSVTDVFNEIEIKNIKNVYWD